MRVLVALLETEELIVLNETMISVPREQVRDMLRVQFDTPWVWWEDEVGTDRDPIRGPSPVIGPRAKT